jgi:quercetin dioxygenase-like cupin family protein
MRATISLLFLLPLVSGAATAEPTDLHVDVPVNSRNLEVNVVEQDLAPGETTGWQIHHGYEIAYILTGSVDLQMAGSPIRHVSKGETFEIERDVAHKVANDGTQPAALLITYLRDKTGPVSISVPPPAVR